MYPQTGKHTVEYIFNEKKMKTPCKSRCRTCVRHWGHQSYTLVHDTDTEGAEFAFDLVLYVGCAVADGHSSGKFAGPGVQKPRYIEVCEVPKYRGQQNGDQVLLCYVLFIMKEGITTCLYGLR
ncbi:OGFD1-like protein [Mya arenaria]|uniref:OGFD1-like protein n=1 Tax=Mya arenaria TaxID=6604 RepID=A0ABY7FQ42_MYAAR|nr:OGFD1-like protein [Mya arenaria]